MKILDKLGYWAYYGVEIESLGIAAENEGNIYGIFNIKALDKISANRIDDAVETDGRKIESALKSFENALVKCIEKNTMRMDETSRKKFLDSISNAVSNTKNLYSGYGEDSVEYLNEQLEELSKKFSSNQLQLCLKLLKHRYAETLYTKVWYRKIDECNRLMSPLFNAIEKNGIDEAGLNNLKKQFNVLLKM